jgi:hypothetical protein
MFDFSKLKRNPTLGKTILEKTKGGQIIAKAACQVIVPSRYFEVGLGTFSDNVECLGVFLLVSDGQYAVSTALAIMPFTPDTVSKIMVDDAEYTVMNFSKGAVLCPNYHLVKADTLLYYIDEWFYKSARIPFFFSQADAGRLMRDLEYYTGVKVTSNNRPWELIASYISRDAKNIRQFYRFVGDKKLTPCIYVPLDSVAFSAVSTPSKLSGAYLDEGLLSAALHKSEEISNIEEVIRS